MANVLIGEFAHESNTFAKGVTDRADFRERREFFYEELIEKLRGTNTSIGGAIEVAEERGQALYPTVATTAKPGGVVASETYAFYHDYITDAAKEHADAIEGVFLGLHGAMVPEGGDDGEGLLLAAVRDIVGDNPIVATFDLHGNVSDQMVAKADALIACETYPHIDMGETGRTAMDLLGRCIDDEVEPVMHVERPPVLPQGPLQNTREGPMAEVMAIAREFERRDSLLKVNVFPGYHMADIPDMGCSIPIVADGDSSAAVRAAREIATHVWDHRENFVGDFPTPEEAVNKAARLLYEQSTGDGPIVLADVGDNPGGGSAGDGTAMLSELLDRSFPGRAGLAVIQDPEAVDDCVTAGVRERTTVTLGGKTDAYHGEPISDLQGYVAAITDGKFKNTGPMDTGTRNDLGRAVRFACGVDDAITVIVSENQLQPLDAEIWRHVGIQPERLDLIVVKSTNHYRADYEPMASEVIVVDSPGLSAIDVSSFHYERIDRPQFPVDEMSDDAYPDWS